MHNFHVISSDNFADEILVADLALEHFIFTVHAINSHHKSILLKINEYTPTTTTTTNAAFLGEMTENTAI